MPADLGVGEAGGRGGRGEAAASRWRPRDAEGAWPRPVERKAGGLAASNGKGGARRRWRARGRGPEGMGMRLREHGQR